MQRPPNLLEMIKAHNLRQLQQREYRLGYLIPMSLPTSLLLGPGVLYGPRYLIPFDRIVPIPGLRPSQQGSTQ
jgi:hypothetical protein